jgi:hypothetical protein
MNQDDAELISMIRDAQRPLIQRLEAIDTLVRSGSAGALRILLDIGERENERAEVLRASGSGLAVLVHHGARLNEFDLRDLQRAAYDAFCEWRPGGMPPE